MERRYTSLVVIGFVILLLAAVSIGCGAAGPTATAVPPASPAPPVAPTAGPAMTATTVIATPTGTVSSPTPTRTLPTPTASVSGQPVYGGTLRYAYNLDLDTLDPAYNNSADSYQVFYPIYDTLFRADQSGNLHPGLASSWEFSPDGKTITAKLRTGVKFHDGTDFNASAVKWNFDRMLDQNQGTLRRAELQPFLAGVEVLDQNTVTLKLIKPFRPFIPQLATERMGFLVSPAAVQKYGGGKDGGYSRNPVGTGPFRFIEWTQASRFVVKRNDSYWDKGKPYLDQITYTSVPDPTTLIAILRTGEVDIIVSWQVTGAQAPLLESNPQLRVVRFDGTSTFFFSINPNRDPFNNKALRQAISYSLDREQFAKTLLSGYGTSAYTLVANGWAYNPDLKPIKYDTAMAKQKLIEAGYPNGVTVPIGCRTTGAYYDMCTILQAIVQNAEVGIKIDIKPMQTAGYFTFITDTGYWKAVGFGQVQFGYRIDPHTLLFNMAYSKGSWNADGYNNPEVDKLIDEAATIYDTTKAKPLYDSIQRIITEDGLAIFAARGSGIFPMNKRVQGYIANPSVFDHLEFLWLEK
ncbi:MAG: ABC transporter substrate-binding protein [Chloroflexi bacterium]|nr:ABC transporter substrate-binding protein [Chloroflexota bacterium]